MKYLRTTLASLLATSALAAAGSASAAYPERSVHVVIPYTAGAGTDIMFRQIAPYLEQELGGKIVVENKPGANADIGNDYVARAAPDGYTLLVNSSNVLLRPMIDKQVKYSVDNSFTPVSRLVTTQVMMVTNAGTPFKTFPEFVDYAKKNPNKLNFGGVGIGAPADLIAELLRLRLSTEFVTVPYKGLSNAIVDLLGGNVDFTFASPLNVKQFIEEGKLRALATTGEQRNPSYPNTPTFKEAGADVAPMDIGAWFGMFAPAGTPESVTNHISSALARALANPKLVESLAVSGYAAAPTTPQAYAAQLRREGDIWKQVIPTFLKQ